MNLRNVQGFEDYFLSPVRKRFPSREVRVGDVGIGGQNPIRVQSMTNTDTNDVDATVAQTIRLVGAGCELVRITTQGLREVESLAAIKKQLRQKGYPVPLIADIHFNPKVAEAAAAVVEKVRINPGNYMDKKSFRKVDFTEQEYREELERISERIFPLLKICKEHGTAIRLGSNHGSLSDRIMSRYGDTPEGMAESALEFVRICQSFGFPDMVLSMKASNVRVMVQATRLLVHRMMMENMNYPLHLGVTEAGDGEDGIIKSAAGIGALLEDGIGDTIRVSLTGDPVPEIPVALAIASRYNNSPLESVIEASSLTEEAAKTIDPFSFRKFTGSAGKEIGGHHPVQVLLSDKEKVKTVNEVGEPVGSILAGSLEDYIVLKDSVRADRLNFIQQVHTESPRPVILKKEYFTPDKLHFQVNAAIDFGALLIDGIGDAVWPIAPDQSVKTLASTAFSILQATRTRITRTEFISCPSCGRTLFDLEATVRRIRERMGHLTGLKIAVMGCIVNGPGEMADADYGYVGAGKARVTLYKGKEVIRKNIPEKEALDALVDLVTENGDWKEQ